MNFEVRGGKVYKDAKRESHGSNWERIESIDHVMVLDANVIVGSNWERIESLGLRGHMLQLAESSNWERIERCVN